jgi:RND family efflux transporter MFP subunit
LCLRHKNLQIAAIWGVLWGVGACRGDTKPRAEESGRAAEAHAPREVQLDPVVLAELEQTIEVSGTLAADVQISLATKVPGRLASISVDLSSPVRQGQVLAEIERIDYEIGVRQADAALAQVRAQLGLWEQRGSTRVDVEAVPGMRQARATLEEARANAQRMEALVTQGLTPEAELTTARAVLARAEAGLETARQSVQLRQAELAQRESELAIARQRLADTAIRSPIDGFVQTRWVNRGEYLAAGARVVELMRVDPLRLRVALPEREAQRVAAGQAVEVRLDGAEPAVASARGVVARVAPGLDSESRSLLIEADIPNPGNLRPGHFVRARIRTGVRQVVSVPRTAIVTFAGLDKVLTVRDGKTVEVPVTLGESLPAPASADAGGAAATSAAATSAAATSAAATSAAATSAAATERVEIVRGLKVGEQVVRAPGSLQQGQPVRVPTGP